MRPTTRKRVEWVGCLVAFPFNAYLGDKHARRWPDQGAWSRTDRSPARSWRRA